MFILPLAKLDIVGARTASYSLIFPGYVPVDIQVVTLLLSNVFYYCSEM